MNCDLEKNYRHSLQIISELYQSSSEQHRSQLEQLQFQLGVFREDAEKSLDKIEKLHNVKSLIQDQLEYSLKLFIRRNKMGTVNTHWDDLNHFSFAKLDKIIEVMPFSYYALKFIGIKRKVSYSISKSMIIASGEIDDLVDLKSIRAQAYALTRSMFSRHVLLTFEIIEDKKKGKALLRLVFDMSKNDNYIYGVKLDSNSQSYLGLPVNFKSYKISRDNFLIKDKHHIVTIGNDLKVHKNIEYPAKLNTNLESAEILHFPFLFRPLSLIIPREGEVYFSPHKADKNNTGCMNAYEHDVPINSESSSNFVYFDFFSLFNS